MPIVYHKGAVQISTLLSIKTGGCTEDCAYCPQSVHYDTGVKAEKLMAVDAVLAEARTAKAADWHICPRPGTDGALAMGFINSIIEQGLVDQDYVDQHTYGSAELKARAAEFTPEYVEKAKDYIRRNQR